MTSLVPVLLPGRSAFTSDTRTTASGAASSDVPEEPQQAQLISIADEPPAPTALPPVRTSAAAFTPAQHPHSTPHAAPQHQAASATASTSAPAEPRSGVATPPRGQDDSLQSVQRQLTEAMGKLVSLTATCRSQKQQISQLQVQCRHIPPNHQHAVPLRRNPLTKLHVCMSWW